MQREKYWFIISKLFYWTLKYWKWSNRAKPKLNQLLIVTKKHKYGLIKKTRNKTRPHPQGIDAGLDDLEHIMFCVQALSLTRLAQIVVWANAALVADADNCTFTSIAGHSHMDGPLTLGALALPRAGSCTLRLALGLAWFLLLLLLLLFVRWLLFLSLIWCFSFHWFCRDNTYFTIYYHICRMNGSFFLYMSVFLFLFNY